MHRNHRRKFNAAQYNYQGPRWFRLKDYRTEYNRKLRRQECQHLHHERLECLPLRNKPRDFNGSFI